MTFLHVWRCPPLACTHISEPTSNDFRGHWVRRKSQGGWRKQANFSDCTHLGSATPDWFKIWAYGIFVWQLKYRQFQYTNFLKFIQNNLTMTQHPGDSSIMAALCRILALHTVYTKVGDESMNRASQTLVLHILRCHSVLCEGKLFFQSVVTFQMSSASKIQC